MKQCCPKQNVTTYPDGTGVCQSCRTVFEAGEAVTTGYDPDVVAALTQRMESLEGENSELKRQIGEVQDAITSLGGRVLTLEGQPTQ